MKSDNEVPKEILDFLEKYQVIDGRGNMDGAFVPLSVAMIAVEKALKKGNRG